MEVRNPNPQWNQPLEGTLCGKTPHGFLTCQLPAGHEGECDVRFDLQAAEAQARIRPVPLPRMQENDAA